MRKKLVVLTGSGISSESGLRTFREAGGLWEGYDVHEVATPQAWEKDQKLVLRFYNERRKQALEAEPNLGHITLKELEDYFEVVIVTQNVDNLHEKAGSSTIIHLHGELFKSRSTANPDLVYDVEGWQLNKGDTCEIGSQLRPHIVWFGEMVPKMDEAAAEVMSADILMVVGTSLVVYPAAGLVHYADHQTPIFVIDPKIPAVQSSNTIIEIADNASVGLPKAKEILLRDYQ